MYACAGRGVRFFVSFSVFGDFLVLVSLGYLFRGREGRVEYVSIGDFTLGYGLFCFFWFISDEFFYSVCM